MRRVAFVLYPGFQVMTFAVTSVFEIANLLAAPALLEPYEITLVSETGGRLKASSGLEVETEAFGVRDFHTLIVGGGTEVTAASPRMIRYLRDASEHCHRVAATCTAAFMLAEAGLLDGRRATTHWAHALEFAERFPQARMETDRIFVTDGKIWTSAGMTAGIDLALAMVEADHGPAVARAVARKLVIYHRRAGGQSQHSALLELAPKSDRIQTALTFAQENLHTALTVGDLAEVAHLSPRQFSRAFLKETGVSPAKAIEQLRLESARLMLEDSHHPIEIVARQTGFGDRERMRRAFVRAFGRPPQDIRRDAQVAVVV